MANRKNPVSRAVTVAVMLLSTAACHILYQPDVQQGNQLSAKTLASLKPGMTKSQVEFLLGAPPVADPFTANRWDYFYSYQHDGGRRYQQTLTLRFSGNALTSITGDRAATPAMPPVPETPAS